MTTTSVKQVKSILSRSQLPGSDWAANPYLGCSHACIYCYARFMQRFSAQNGPWGSFVEAKDWPELDPIKERARLAGKSILIGSVTDPYLPEEEQFQRTRTLLQQLLALAAPTGLLSDAGLLQDKGLLPDEELLPDEGFRLTIITKSDLILRDLALLQQFPQVQVVFSINTLDEDLKAQLDAAPSIARRLAALQACHDAGLTTACFIAPIMPGLTDVAAIIYAVRHYCHEIWLDSLNLHPSCKEPVMRYISTQQPHLMPLYHAIYEAQDQSFWRELDRYLRQIAAACDLPYSTDFTELKPADTKPALVNLSAPKH